jgi:hypothetical protein
MGDMDDFFDAAFSDLIHDVIFKFNHFSKKFLIFRNFSKNFDNFLDGKNV